MAFVFLVKGYGGLCTLKFPGGSEIKLLTTNYSISKQRNWLKSQSITGNHYDYVLKKFKKYQDVMVRDYPVFELKIDFEMTPLVLDGFIKYISDNENQKPRITPGQQQSQATQNGITVSFYEKNYNGNGEKYTYTFTGARLTDFSFDTSENSLVKGSASFLVIKNEFYIENIYYKKAGTSGMSHTDNEKELMPYWNVYVKFGNESLKCTDISFEWSQQNEIKFLLKNSTETDDYGNSKAVDPVKVLWHLPTAKFSMTVIYDNESHTENKNPAYLENKDFTIYYGNKSKIYCSESYIETYTPIMGDKDSYIGYSLSGFVNGITKGSKT